MGSDPFDFKLYRYDLSLPAAIVFIVLFTISSSHHIYKLLQTRVYYFIPLAIGAVFEVIGYCGRAASSSDKEALPPYMVQSLTILVAPALFCASIYMILGRMVRLLEAESRFTLVPLKWCTKLFVTGDIISFLLQGAGGGVMGGGTIEMYDAGEKIVVGGVFVQIVVFGFFLIVAIHFHRSILNNPTEKSLELAQKPLKNNWKVLLYCMYTGGALIMIRSIFRAIEFLMGNAGPLMTAEAWIYGFDAVLMFLAIGIFNWCHPSGVIEGRPREAKRDTAVSGSDTEQGYELMDRE